MRFVGISAIFAAVIMAVPVSAPAQTLDGAIEMHCHTGPDGSPRSIDSMDLARLAKSKGMRAIMIKNHDESTAAQAYLKVVWPPTNDSEANVKRAASGAGRGGADGGRGAAAAASASAQPRPYVSVMRDGKILPEVIEVFDLVAKYNMVPETGHSSPGESLVHIPEAKRHGVKNIMVTHAFANPGGSMTIGEAHQAAKDGAYIELVYDPFDDATLDHMAEAMRTIGASSIVISSDLGQRGRPLRPDGLLLYYQALAKRGISVADIDQMARVNPAGLPGLRN